VPQSRSGRGSEEERPSLCQELNPGCPARSLVTILTELHYETVRKMACSFLSATFITRVTGGYMELQMSSV